MTAPASSPFSSSPDTHAPQGSVLNCSFLYPLIDLKADVIWPCSFLVLLPLSVLIASGSAHRPWTPGLLIWPYLGRLCFDVQWTLWMWPVPFSLKLVFPPVRGRSINDAPWPLPCLISSSAWMEPVLRVRYQLCVLFYYMAKLMFTDEIRAPNQPSSSNRRSSWVGLP